MPINPNAPFTSAFSSRATEDAGVLTPNIHTEFVDGSLTPASGADLLAAIVADVATPTVFNFTKSGAAAGTIVLLEDVQIECSVVVRKTGTEVVYPELARQLEALVPAALILTIGDNLATDPKSRAALCSLFLEARSMPADFRFVDDDVATAALSASALAATVTHTNTAGFDVDYSLRFHFGWRSA